MAWVVPTITTFVYQLDPSTEKCLSAAANVTKDEDNTPGWATTGTLGLLGNVDNAAGPVVHTFA